MNSTQNKKIEQVKETTMIVGIDIGSEKHYFRAFNWRGVELTRKPVAFGTGGRQLWQAQWKDKDKQKRAQASQISSFRGSDIGGGKE